MYNPGMIYSDEQIARIIHEANSVLQDIQGDEVPSQPWACESADIRENVIAGVRNARHGMTPEQHHEAWVADKRARGWRYGSEKDSEKKTHPCMVPFAQLPKYQQDKNNLFIAIVWALYAKEPWPSADQIPDLKSGEQRGQVPSVG